MAEGGEREGRRGQMRRRILAELCGRRRTTGELSREFGISATAVRDHLMILEQEGLVRYRVERRGPGKPKHVYELTEQGETQLSSGYLPVLAAVLADLEQRAGRTGLETVLRDAGRALAGARSGAEGRLNERVEAAAARLAELGGIMEVAGSGSGAGFSVQGRCCPLGSLSPRVPLLCKMFETVLAEITGATVRERCDRDPPPHCRFDVALEPTASDRPPF